MKTLQPSEDCIINPSTNPVWGRPVRIGAGLHRVVFTDPILDELATQIPDIAQVTKIGRELSDQYEVVQEVAADRNRRLGIMGTFFGTDLVPERYYVQTVFYNAGNRETNVGRVAYALASRQHQVDDIFNPASFISVTLPYVEEGDSSNEASLYAKVTSRWVEQWEAPGYPTDKEVADFITLTPGQWLKDVVHASETNGAFREGLTRFAYNALRYSSATRELIDIMNENNVIITKDGQCRIIDALCPVDKTFIDELPGTLDRIKQQQKLTRSEVAGLLNGLQCMRTLNFLAAYTGIAERVHPAAKLGSLPTSSWSLVRQALYSFLNR